MELWTDNGIMDGWERIRTRIIERNGVKLGLYYQAPMDSVPCYVARAVAFKNGKIRIWATDGSGFTLEPCAEQVRRFTVKDPA